MSKNLERKARNQKRQTRLRFDPISQTSPANGLSPANVRYEIQSGRRTPASNLRVVLDDSESDDILTSTDRSSRGPTFSTLKAGKMPVKALPTPTKSSQPLLTGGFIDSPDGLEGRTSNVAAATTGSSIHTRGFMSGLKVKKQRTGLPSADSLDESDLENDGITPSKKLPTKRTPTALVISSSSDTDDDADIPAVKVTKKSLGESSSIPPQRKTSRKQVVASQNKSVVLSDSSDDDLALPARKVKQTRNGSFRSTQPSRSKSLRSALKKDEEDEDSIYTHSPQGLQQPAVSGNKDNKDEEDEEDDIRSSPRRRPRPIIPTELKDEEQEDHIPRLKRGQTAVEDSDSDIVESAFKRPRNTPVFEDSDSDLPSVSQLRRKDSKVETPARFTRQARGRRHRTEKEKTLELLKRRRAGEDISQLTETSESDSEDDEDDPSFEKLEEFEDEEEDVVVSKPRSKPPKPAAVGDSYESLNNELDEDFIVEDDDDDPLGIPPMHTIPLEFTHQAHKPLKQHFKDAVEWMVHNKLNPAFARGDPVYMLAFQKLENECSGLAKSKFSSTQWTRDFTVALYARPYFVTGPLAPGEGIDRESGKSKCDACNHRSHVPSAFIQFQGKAYNKDSLEELNQDSDDTDEESISDDSSHASVNYQGQELPSENKKWFVGRYCFANAEQSHTLIHWKFALYEWVKGSLEAEGELLPENLAKREKMKAKKRTGYANAVVDRWESDGQIKSLYRDFKNQISTARSLMETGRGGWK